LRRIDNCSGETLHVQQVGCLDDEDVLPPYSCLPYTWDEPSLPNKVRRHVWLGWLGWWLARGKTHAHSLFQAPNPI